MDADLINIFIFILLASFLILSMAQLFHRRVVRHEERKLELKVELERAKTAKAVARVEDGTLIEDRLRVLERIVTDQPTNLSKEIESLRRTKEGVE